MRAGRAVWSLGVAVLAFAAFVAHAFSKTDEPKPDASQGQAGREKTVTPKGKLKPDYLDKMIREAWENAESEGSKKLKPTAIATDPEFLRRIYIDMLGRIPTVAEAKGFISHKDANKRVKLVQQLLEHPDYGKNFGTIWTITLIGRSNQGRMVDRGALSAWLRKQFSDNRPWNEIARELIDAKGSNKDNGAVNFPLSHLEFDRVPLTSVTTRVFLGKQIQCTQCHDHPLTNEWKQSHFWGINAFFKGLRTRDVMKADASGAEVYDHTELFDNPTEEYASFDRRDGQVGVAFPTFLDGRKPGQGTDVDRRFELAKYITEGNPDLARAFVNRMWAHFLGRGIIHPVDDFRAGNEAAVPGLLDKLAADFEANGYDVKMLVRWITTSEVYNLSSRTTPVNEKDESLFSHMALKPMTPEQLFDSLITATSAHKVGGAGDNDKRRDQWLRQFLFTFGNDEGTETTNFQGTIPQALMMMNGELMAKAVSCQPGSFLEKVREQSMLQNKQPVDAYIVQHLFLAALSRYPTAAELNKAREYLSVSPDSIQILEDLFWALLNSNEFVLNH